MQAAAAGIKEDECNSYKNLITGTRYLNVDGMLPFETRVLEYIENNKNHVMYRVTPIYKGKQLVARGVQMEAYSVEDNGKGICFNVYCYNIQPGIKINYSTGTTKKKKDPAAEMALAIQNGASTVYSDEKTDQTDNTFPLVQFRKPDERKKQMVGTFFEIRANCQWVCPMRRV